jgi:vitamin B12 transporter
LPSSTSYTDFRRVRAGATSRFTLHRDVSLTLSAGVRQEAGSNTGFLDSTVPQSYRASRTSLLAGSEIEYSIPRFTATAGFSFDKTDGYGEVTSPRLGVNWMPVEQGPRLKTSWAKGFKLPSFYALGNPIVGNRELRPERANSFDAGIEQPIGHSRATVSLTYFRNDFKGLVDFDSVTFRLLNLGRTLIQGAEIGADYAATARVHFGLDFSYMAWNLFGSTQPLRNVPHGNGGVHLDWKFSTRFRARVETQWMGRRYDYQIPVPDVTSVGGYSSTNVSANYSVNRKVSFYLRGDNLFDSKFHEYIGFPNPGAVIRAGVIVHALAK